ncbi:hypothetical protein GALMADRAFT_217994 [Galerina marginata CBS 339.88]|uniref:Mid2 domain-containing protein n=1 Tax=Galerina marginata (strain CBS 339.88) TaxID=685588 RepID=A0A067U0Q1_GALM3|nr:hypothetical protein GALMADRAFT_217994 [Galerina marginata CBS 339.88]
MKPAVFSLLAVALSLFSAVSVTTAFTFTFNPPSECDPLSLTWTGGTPPFQLLVIPVFGRPQNMSIPASAFNNGQGSYSFQLPFAKTTQMLLTMSDATGFNSGGSTNVLTVLPSKGGSCDTTLAKVDFSFELNSALQQCRPFLFTEFANAIQPVTIGIIIPGGNTILLHPPVGSTSFSWNANAAQGTSMLFFMTDAQGRQGGSSDVRIVGVSDDNSCLDASSPSSTSGPPSPTVSAPSTTGSSGPSPTSSAPAKGGISIAAVAGTVIGALLFLAVIVTLGLFFLRRKRDASTFRRHSRRMGSALDLNYDSFAGAPGPPPGPHYGIPPSTNIPPTSPYPYSSDLAAPYASNPFLDASPAQTPSHHQTPSQYDASSMYTSSRYQPSELSYQNPGGYRPPSQLYPPPQTYPPQTYPPQTYPPPDPFNTTGPPLLPGSEYESYSRQSGAEQSTSRDSMSTAQRKAAMAGAATYKPSRFIVHTDVEDDLPPPNEDGIVELPPQYSERRGPLGSLDPNPPAANAGYHRPGAP